LGGTIDAATLIAPQTFNAKDAGFEPWSSSNNVVLPSGGIVTREGFCEVNL
jgi:hypothetical protein